MQVAVPSAPSRRLRQVGVAAALVVAIAGGAAWMSSAHSAVPPPAPLRVNSERIGVARVGVGARVVFIRALVAAPGTLATITGITLPHIPGLRISVHVLGGRPHAAGLGHATVILTTRRSFAQLRLPPIAGRSLGPRALRVAIVARPLRPGCYAIARADVRYRIGDTQLTTRLGGVDVVSTTRRTCFPPQ